MSCIGKNPGILAQNVFPFSWNQKWLLKIGLPQFFTILSSAFVQLETSLEQSLSCSCDWHRRIVRKTNQPHYIGPTLPGSNNCIYLSVYIRHLKMLIYADYGLIKQKSIFNFWKISITQYFLKKLVDKKYYQDLVTPIKLIFWDNAGMQHVPYISYLRMLEFRAPKRIR